MPKIVSKTIEKQQPSDNSPAPMAVAVPIAAPVVAVQEATGDPPLNRVRVGLSPLAHDRQLPEKCEDDESSAFTADGKACVNTATISQGQNLYYANGEESKYAFCPIPKNGCTYHVGLMVRVMGATMWSRPIDVHPREAREKLFMNGDDFAKVWMDHSIPKYVVVRNPMSRTLSGYLNKVEKFLPEREHTMDNFKRWVYTEFPRGAKRDRSWKGMNAHWRPQTTMCGFKVRDLWSYMTVFRTEEPASYVEYLYNIVDEKYLKDGWGDNNTSLRESVLGKRSRSENTTEKFYKYFNTVDLFDHVAKAMVDDVEMLGYEKEVAEMRKNIVQQQ